MRRIPPGHDRALSRGRLREGLLHGAHRTRRVAPRHVIADHRSSKRCRWRIHVDGNMTPRQYLYKGMPPDAPAGGVDRASQKRDIGVADSLHGSGGAKPIHWVGSAKKDLAAFPRTVRREVGFALYLAQLGMRAVQTKSLRGFGGASVLEIVVEHESNAFRTVYTVAFPKAIYVLHAFHKKSKSGISTPREDVAIIKQRLAAAVIAYRQSTKGKRHDDGAR